MKLNELKAKARLARAQEYDEYCFSGRDAEQFNHGFDAGAAAVMKEAEKLEKEIMRLVLDNQADFHRSVCLRSRGCHCKGIRNDVLDDWQRFVGETKK